MNPIELESANWRHAVLNNKSTIQQAIQCLDVSGMQIVLVVSDDEVLVGTLTDGDIRRALLKGYSLQTPVDEVVHTTPLLAPPEMGRDVVLQLMKANRVRQLPVVDVDRRVVGLHLWDEILSPSIRQNSIVIMAGGKGARLRPFTENCPKPMLKVGGKPMLEHIIERAKVDGFINFIVAIHYLGRVIEDYFKDGSDWGVSIKYLREKSPLGTAGALSLISESPQHPIIVTNGDLMTDLRFGEILEFHTRHSAVATMAVRQYELQNPFGVVKTKGLEIVSFEEKPIHRSYVNAGIYVLDPSAFNRLDGGESCDMPTLFSRLQEDKRKVIVFPMHEPWHDIGYPEDLLLANKREASE